MTACPQLVYTSASRTLEGPGFGVFAMSAQWPRSLGTSRSRLGPLIRPPADGEAYGVLSCSGGRLAYRKVALAADDFGRSGNYVVQLLWDDAASLTARDVLALHRADGFLSALAAEAEPSREAPPVTVPPAVRSAPSLTADDIDALVPSLAAVLSALESGAGTVRLPTAAVLFDVLPLGLAAGVSLHAGTADTMGDAAAVQVLAIPHASPQADATNGARARALLEMAAKAELCPDDVARFDELDAWLFADAWMRLDPPSLTDAQLVAVLTAPGAGRWLAAPRAASAAMAAAGSSPEVENALRAAIRRDRTARAGVRVVELDAVLRTAFDGVPARGKDFTGLTQGDLAAGFTREISLGRRLPRVTAEAGLLIEQALSLGHDVPLVGLTDDVEGLADLAGRRPVVREALLREWSLTPWSSAHDDLLGQLVRADPEWVGRLASLSPEAALKSALTSAARELPARSVERLAVTVASSSVAGRGWALRCVLFPCGLPAENVAAIIGRHFELFARDDSWPRPIARETGAALTQPPDEPPKRRRR